MKRLAAPLAQLLITATAAFGAPSEMPNQHPLGLMHLSTVARGAHAREAGTLELRLSGALSNTFNVEPDTFIVDTETREGALELDYGMFPGMSLSLRQGVHYRGGGHSDQLIDEWHQTYGLPRGPRRKFPKDSYAIEGITTGGEEFSIDRHGTAFGDLDLGMKYEILRSGNDTLLTFAPAIRLPTGADTFGQDSVDVGLTLVAAKKLGRFELTAGATYLYFLDTTAHALRFEQNHYGGYLSLEYAVSAHFALIVDMLGESSMLDNVPEFPEYQTYIDAGFRWRFLPEAMLEIFLREDPAPEDSTSDVTILGAVRWQLDTSK